ncbi:MULTISPECIES: WXG100 family type VII secretion target [unclassified Mycobacterium]|uniref:WXG100 family type VII secretion target n=1 Tax=unclassified Mycobacterium TaxID=2642494 RepID=UPI00073FC373|nr:MULTISPECIES: WXG100 family type VII secretion target [unclassified Mycobacterium]KUH85689.1 hypothetical protein AU186_23435 [Mycobacterium sp. GA-1999]KUH91546.1 hypothetical protein AU185_10500 [Mycobacterium sp. GA-0227b]KUH96215.1 hypothetical protein AU187_13430 [Mycobacterium sp. IS-1556]
MSGPMRYNFGGIEGDAGELAGAVAQVQGLLAEGKGSLTALQSVWGGSGSDAYQQLQMRWDASSEELNDALKNLGLAVSEAGHTMAHADSTIAGRFGG